MRNRQFLLVTLLSFLSWGGITYYLFLHRPQIKVYDLSGELDKLNDEIKQQYELNTVLLQKLRDFRTAVDSQQHPVFPPVQSFPQRIDSAPVIAVLVFSCNRPAAVKRSLDQIMKYRPSKQQFPVIVTQDCGDAPTTEVIQSYGDQLTLIHQPDKSDIPVPPKEKKLKGYYKISRHYGWALNQTFNRFYYDSVIVVEDDLDLAPDFFEYFAATHPILKADPTLWCVSAWNDNGKDKFIDLGGAELLHRTDFFPGLGWMLTKSLWLELETKWPKAYWDDWMRAPEQRRDRACIRPEISRTKTFGKIGVSNGLFFEKHLKFIKLNDNFVPFLTMDLSFLMKDKYDREFLQKVYSSPSVTWDQLKRGEITQPGSVRVTYATTQIYQKLAKVFGLMDDLKAGVPRTAYRGVVSFMYQNRRVYLAPQNDWKSYNISAKS